MRNSNFEIIARVMIRKKGEILLCRRKDRDYYFLPGGHVEFGEMTVDALKREMREELGIEIKNPSYLGSVENIFREDGSVHHEINLVFRSEAHVENLQSMEDHLSFSFLNTREFLHADILPKALKKALIKWLMVKRVFWVSECESYKGSAYDTT